MKWIILVVISASLVNAEQNSFVWDPAETTAGWENPARWSLGRVPNKYDDVTINEGRRISIIFTHLRFTCRQSRLSRPIVENDFRLQHFH